MEHDSGYRLLYSHRRLVADLLQGFVDEPWVQEIEWSTLQLEDSQHVGSRLAQRRNDLVWRMSIKDGRPLFVYLMLEFQSTVDRHMAVRLLSYLGLFYEQLLRSGSLQGHKLPVVVPVVLYNGGSAWSAELDVRELVEEVPGGLAEYHPRLRYKVIEARSCVELEDSRENLSDVMFRLERAQTEADAKRAVALLQEWLAAGEHATLRRDFSQWITQVVLSARLPGTPVPEARELAEVMKVLDEALEGRGRGAGHGRGRGAGAQGAAHSHRALEIRRTRGRQFGGAAAAG